MKTLRELAQNALDVQDACNLLGVSKGFAQAMHDLRLSLEAAGEASDTMAIRTHPIARMWSDKISDLVGRPGEDAATWDAAYEGCKALAEGTDGGS